MLERGKKKTKRPCIQSPAHEGWILVKKNAERENQGRQKCPTDWDRWETKRKSRGRKKSSAVKVRPPSLSHYSKGGPWLW